MPDAAKSAITQYPVARTSQHAPKVSSTHIELYTKYKKTQIYSCQSKFLSTDTIRGSWGPRTQHGASVRRHALDARRALWRLSKCTTANKIQMQCVACSDAEDGLFGAPRLPGARTQRLICSPTTVCSMRARADAHIPCSCEGARARNSSANDPGSSAPPTPAPMLTISAPQMLHPETEYAQTSVSAQAAQRTPRHDTEHMAQIWASGPRTLHTSLDIMAKW